jgi:hypothetical protein
MSRGLPVRSGCDDLDWTAGLQGSLLVAIAAALVLGACATVPEGAERRRPAGRTPARPQPTDPVAREAPLRVGLVLSQTGSQVMQRYAEQVREGADLAAANAGRPVELVVLDDGGTPAGAERAIRQLEAQGISVVVGPLLDEALTAAARARSNDALLLISPTAVAQPGGGAERVRIERSGRARRHGAGRARAPARPGGCALRAHAGRDPPGAGLHGRIPAGRRHTDGRRLRSRHHQRERAADPAPAGRGGRHLFSGVGPGTEPGAAADRVLRPGRAQLYGSEAWLGEAARNVPARLLEGAVLAISLPRESAEVGWQDFVELYENAHRRTLDSPVPALGYDAVQLAVRRLTGVSGEHRGATGVLTVQPDRITRRAFLVRIQSGRLVPVN